MRTFHLLPPLLATLLCTGLLAQDTKPSQAAPELDKKPATALGPLTYAENKDTRIARANDQFFTLHDLLEHIDKRHRSGVLALAKSGNFRSTLQSNALLIWIRQFADIKGLEQEAKEREIKPEALLEARQILLDKEFEKHLQDYKASHPNSEDGFSDATLRHLRKNYLLKHGLALEVESLLLAMMPQSLTQADVDQFYRLNPEIFVGLVDLAHIFVNTRDPKSGRLLTGAEQIRSIQKIANIKKRLKKDGSNFEEVAALLSEDRRSAASGGVLSNVNRFDRRLPASICRAAWTLANGQFTGPVESQYGQHFVKRIEFHQTSTIVRLDPNNEKVREFVYQFLKEQILFKTREAYQVKTLY